MFIWRGGPGGGSLTDPVATSQLEAYIDGCKPDYIQNFDDNLTDLKAKIDASHNAIIQTITTAANNNASVYLLISRYLQLVLFQGLSYS